jgi:mevalonate pyrophosphate decarboxylase
MEPAYRDHSCRRSLCVFDTIFLVDKGEKQVSSTVGHDLMHDHPYAERRFKAHDNLDQLIAILKADVLFESEVDAMMMTSMPYFILMKPNTLKIINAIWKFRNDKHQSVSHSMLGKCPCFISRKREKSFAIY